MTAIPVFEIGVWNAWIFMLIYILPMPILMRIHKGVLEDSLKSYGEAQKKANYIMWVLWAQRSRLSTEAKSEQSNQLLKNLADLEKAGELTVREKYVDLFILDNIEREDPKTLRSIRRKMKRTKELYPAEMKKLLPPSPKGRVSFTFKRGRRKNR